MMTWPKPVQKPYPPIIVGGAFPQAARRAARYGDGWIPLAGRGGDILSTLPGFHELLRNEGRDPSACPITMFNAPDDHDTLARYRDAGVQRVVVSLPAEGDDNALPILDRWAELMRRL